MYTYLQPHQYINSYPINFRSLNDCLYVDGDFNIDTPVEFGSWGGFNRDSSSIIESIANVNVHKPDLIMRGKFIPENFSQVIAANVLKRFIIDTLSPMNMIASYTGNSALIRSAPVDSNNYSEMDGGDYQVIKWTSFNTSEYSEMDTTSFVRKHCSFESDAYPSFEGEYYIIKLTEKVDMISNASFAIYDMQPKSKIYRGYTLFTSGSIVRFRDELKQWYVPYTSESEFIGTSIHAKTGNVLVLNTSSLEVEDYIKQWYLPISTISTFDTQGTIGKTSYTTFDTAVCFDNNGGVIYNNNSYIPMETYTSFAPDVLVLFNSCPTLHLWREEDIPTIGQVPVEDTAYIVQLDKSCYKNL